MQTHTERPAQAAGAISRQPAVRQRQREKAAVRVLKLREKASAEIERLIAFLDASDGYSTTELEETADDKPCDTDELEADYGNGREADDEPSLGSVAAGQNASQGGWAQGGTDDCELADDLEEGDDKPDDEDCGCYEPSLASPENHVSPVWYYGAPPPGQWADRSGDQTAWARGTHQDLEDEHDGREDPDEDHDLNCDDEPSLGSCNMNAENSQAAWAAGGCDDREADHV